MNFVGQRESCGDVGRRPRPNEPVAVTLRQEGDRAMRRESLERDAAVRSARPHGRNDCCLIVRAPVAFDTFDIGRNTIGDHGQTRRDRIGIVLQGHRRVGRCSANALRRGAETNRDCATSKRRIERGLQRAV